MSKPRILSLLDDKIVNVTLLASNWVDGIYTYSNELIKSNKQIIEMLPRKGITKEEYESLASAMIVEENQGVGTLKIKALGDVPEIDIPVTFIIRGDV